MVLPYVMSEEYNLFKYPSNTFHFRNIADFYYCLGKVTSSNFSEYSYVLRNFALILDNC